MARTEKERVESIEPCSGGKQTRLLGVSDSGRFPGIASIAVPEGLKSAATPGPDRGAAEEQRWGRMAWSRPNDMNKACPPAKSGAEITVRPEQCRHPNERSKAAQLSSPTDRGTRRVNAAKRRSPTVYPLIAEMARRDPLRVGCERGRRR